MELLILYNTNAGNKRLITINTMRSIDGGVTNSNESYLTVMNNNIDLFKRELYK